MALPSDAVDGWRAEMLIQGVEQLAPADADRRLTRALAEWRGEPLTEFAASGWSAVERRRLTELRAQAVERLAIARP